MPSKMSLAAWCCAVGASCLMASAAAAQTSYPDRPIRVVVGFGAGSASDVVARIVLEKAGTVMTPAASFVFENMPGAGGNTGLAHVAKSEPDGYKIAGTAIGPMAINKVLFKNLGYDPETDIEPIANMTFNPNVVAVSAKTPFKSLKELAEYAKANQDKLTYSSVGPGSSQHLGGILFEHLTGAKMRHLPYRNTGQLITDLITNEVPLSFQNIINVLEQSRAGSLRLLAIGAPMRHATIPDVPTSAEAGMPAFLSSSWFALAAPKGTPKLIVDKLNAAVVAALKDPVVVKRLTDIGATPAPSSAAEFKAFISAEIKTWQGILTKAGIQPM